MPLPPITDSDWATSQMEGGLNIESFAPPPREAFPQQYSPFSHYSLWLNDLQSWMSQTHILALTQFPERESYLQFDPFHSQRFRGTTDYSDAPEEEPEDSTYMQSYAWDNLTYRHIIAISQPEILSEELQATQTTMKNPNIRIRYGKTDLIRLQDQFNQEQEPEYLQRRPENFIGKSVLQAYGADRWFSDRLRENGYRWMFQKDIVADYNYSIGGGPVSSEPGPYYINDRYLHMIEWLMVNLPKLQVSNAYQIESQLEGEALLPDEIDSFFDGATFSDLTGEEVTFDDYDREPNEDTEDFRIRMLEDYDWASERENYPFSEIIVNLIEYHDSLVRVADPASIPFVSPTTREILERCAPQNVSMNPERLISKQFSPILLNIPKLTNLFTNPQGVSYRRPEIWFLNNPEAYDHYFTDTYSWRRGSFEWTETFDGTANESYPVLMIDRDDSSGPIFLNYRYRFSFQYSGAKILPINYSTNPPNFWRILSRNQAQ